MAAVEHALGQTEAALISALDGLSNQLSKQYSAHSASAGGHEDLQQTIRQLIAEEIQKRFRTLGAAVEPLGELASNLRQTLAPQLASARALQTLADRVRPLILAVDDDELQHRLLEKALAGEKFDLVFSTSGVGALSLMRKHKPDLVLMDRDLPDIDGIETMGRMKSVEQFACVPVFLITGHREKAVLIESVRAGACDFIVKPFNKSILVAKIRKSLMGMQ